MQYDPNRWLRHTTPAKITNVKFTKPTSHSTKLIPSLTSYQSAQAESGDLTDHNIYPIYLPHTNSLFFFPAGRYNCRRLLRQCISHDLIMRSDRAGQHTRIHNPQPFHPEDSQIRIHHLPHRRAARRVKPSRCASLYPLVDILVAALTRQGHETFRHDLIIHNGLAFGCFKRTYRETDALTYDDTVRLGGVVVGIN